jgi:hypothetical protein
MTMWLKIAWGLISGNLGTVVSAITGTIGKLSDNDTARLTTAVGAERDVAVAQMQASAAAYHDRAAMLAGMWWAHGLIIAALAPPIWHQGLVMLDSCPWLPGLSDGWLPWIVPHQVGAWRVAALPGAYADHEWQLIMSLLGIQSALIGGGSFLRWIKR